MARCARIKDNGERCKGDAMPGADWCYSHDPARAEERRRNASRGGKRGGRGRPGQDLAQIKTRLSDLANDVLGGRVGRGDAAVVGQLLNTVIRAVSVELKVREQMDLIERLEELEILMRHQRAQRHRGA